MQNPIGSTILRGKAAIEEVQALLTQLVQHDADLAIIKDDVSGTPYQFSADLIFTHAEVLAVIQARRDSVVRLLENKGIQIRPDVEGLVLAGQPLSADDPLRVVTDPSERESILQKQRDGEL
jgi:hypothetical protein